MLTNPMTHFGEGEEQRSPTSLPVITEGNVLFCDGTSTSRDLGALGYIRNRKTKEKNSEPQNAQN